MTGLPNQLVIAEREDVARGIRLLLAAPLLTARMDPSGFDLVRRRREPLVKWFDYYCGWRLVVEARSGYARLMKVRGAVDATRPARRCRSTSAPFDRRRYVLLCVAAAELIGTPVTTVGLLADRVVQACSADPALPAMDTSSRSERMALVDALRLLEAYGGLVPLDGVTDSYVDSAAAKVLYRVDATLLMRLVSAPTGPSRLVAPATDPGAQLAELLVEHRYGPDGGDGPHTADEVDPGPSAVQRTLALRHAVFRRLMDDPVVHRDELTGSELAYLTSPTGRQLARRAAEQAGMVLEERAEGWMMVDPDGIATDSRFPDDAGHDRVAALALLDRLGAGGPVAPEQLTAAITALLRRFPTWAKAYHDVDGHRRLRDDALAVLDRFGLVRRSGEMIVATPAAARYAIVGIDAAVLAQASDTAPENVPEMQEDPA